MKKYFYILLFVLLRACTQDPVFAQSSNLFLINDQLTIADTSAVEGSEIDTLSRIRSSSTDNLNGIYTLGFQISVYSPFDTLLMFVGTTAAFTPGMVTTILPGIPFNSAYYKNRTGLNVFFKGKSSTATVKPYYPWAGGI